MLGETIFFITVTSRVEKLQKAYCIKFLGIKSLNPQILYPYMFLLQKKIIELKLNVPQLFSNA